MIREMANCSECLCIDVCDANIRLKRALMSKCEHFKDCTRFVELLCKVGDTVWLFDDGEKFKSKIDEI